MEKISTVKTKGKKILKGQLTIGLDLGDRSSCYCVLDENGEIIREQKIPTTPEGMQQAFGKMARSRIAMETGTHSPWVSRVLTELGHEVIVAHAQKISEECCQVGILIFSNRLIRKTHSSSSVFTHASHNVIFVLAYSDEGNH